MLVFGWFIDYESSTTVVAAVAFQIIPQYCIDKKDPEFIGILRHIPAGFLQFLE